VRSALAVLLEVGAMRGRKDLLYAAHAALVLAFGLGHGIRALQEAGVDRGAGFASSASGRLAAFAAMVLGIPALATVVWTSVLERKDAKVLVLLALLLLALWRRDGLDVPDLVYLVAACASIALWIARGRRE
jgi:hypothetical protein